MDTPIYLRMVKWDDSDKLRNRWYVIEERGSSAGEERASDELGEEHLVRKSPKDRVRILDLPDYDHMIGNPGFAVANSHLFLVGGTYNSEEHVRTQPSGIVYIDLQRSDPSWCEIQFPDESEFKFMRVGGAAVSDDGEWIYAVGQGDRMLRFHPRDVNKEGSSSVLSSFVTEPCPPSPVLLARTETKVFMLRPHYPSSSNSGALPTGELGYCDLKSKSWVLIDPCVPWCMRSTTAVVVRDWYLIFFAVWRPGTDEYRPALYVYDIGRREWLPEPVQGLPNDGHIFPSWEAVGPISDSFLMQVRRDELKLAAVWSDDHVTDNRLDTETLVHCSKFVLRIKQNGENEDIAPTFRAELVSSATFNAGRDCGSIDGTTADNGTRPS
ncbi:hypothetical protein ACLB2K_000063 [Fragaria x ananassa]